MRKGCKVKIKDLYPLRGLDSFILVVSQLTDIINTGKPEIISMGHGKFRLMQELNKSKFRKVLQKVLLSLSTILSTVTVHYLRPIHIYLILNHNFLDFDT